MDKQNDVDTVTLDTIPCVACGKTGSVTVPKQEAYAFRIGVLNIQDAMPTTPPEIREQILTGLHPECHCEGCLCPRICPNCGLAMGASWEKNCEECEDHHWEHVVTE